MGRPSSGRGRDVHDPGRGGDPLRPPDRGRCGGGTRPQTLTAPLPGKITHLAVKAGDSVAVGDTILVIEAMKMENDELRAGAPGTVAEARVRPGQTGNAGVLVVIG